MGPEPKEGDKVKSYKDCPGQAENIVKAEVFIGRFVRNCFRRAPNNEELRCQKSDFSVFCFPCSVRVENSRGFGVWPKPDYLGFFEGGLLCIRN